MTPRLRAVTLCPCFMRQVEEVACGMGQPPAQLVEVLAAAVRERAAEKRDLGMFTSTSKDPPSEDTALSREEDSLDEALERLENRVWWRLFGDGDTDAPDDV